MSNGIIGVTVGTSTKSDRFAGRSAYDIARKYGFKGTEEEWIKSLAGKSAYDYAVLLGFTGTEEEYKLACEAQRILSIVQTVKSEISGGRNVWTATFGHGGEAAFEVFNGAPGRSCTAEVVDRELVIKHTSQDGPEYLLVKDSRTGLVHRLFIENGKLYISEGEV